MSVLPGHVAKRLITLRFAGKPSIIMLPMKSQDPQAGKEITALLATIRPKCVIVDTDDNRMKALHPYVTKEKNAAKHFQSHSLIEVDWIGHMRRGTGREAYLTYNRLLWHIVITHSSDMVSLSRAFFDFFQGKLETMPGADVVLAYDLYVKQGGKMFYCLDRNVQISLSRMTSGLAWKEKMTFVEDLYSTNDLLFQNVNDIDQNHMASMLNAHTLIQEKYPWLHHAGIVERGMFMGLQMKRVAKLLLEEAEDSQKAQEHGGDEKSENNIPENESVKPILFKNVAVAFVNEALVPWIVREWCEQREDAAAVDLLERLAKHNKELNAGEMNEFVQSIKKQRLEELEECVEIGKSAEFLFAEELNRYRFKHFDAHIEFQEKHIRPWIKETNDTSFIEKNSPVSASSEGKEEEKQQNVRNSSPDPFDMIIRSTNKSKLEGKSSSFSHLRRH